MWADGVYLQARMEAEKQCILVLIGATPEGQKELIGFQTGFRESAQSWSELLADLKSRGLSVAPELAIGDGALGFWKSLEQEFHQPPDMRCRRSRRIDPDTPSLYPRIRLAGHFPVKVPVSYPPAELWLLTHGISKEMRVFAC